MVHRSAATLIISSNDAERKKLLQNRPEINDASELIDNSKNLSRFLDGLDLSKISKSPKKAASNLSPVTPKKSRAQQQQQQEPQQQIKNGLSLSPVKKTDEESNSDQDDQKDESDDAEDESEENAAICARQGLRSSSLEKRRSNDDVLLQTPKKRGRKMKKRKDGSSMVVKMSDTMDNGAASGDGAEIDTPISSVEQKEDEGSGGKVRVFPIKLTCSLPLDRLSGILKSMLENHSNQKLAMAANSSLSSSSMENVFVSVCETKGKCESVALTEPKVILDSPTPTSSSISSSSVRSSSPIVDQDHSSHATKSLCLYCDKKFSSQKLRIKHTERVHAIVEGRRLSSRNSIVCSTNVLATYPGCSYCCNSSSGKLTTAIVSEDLTSLFHHLVDVHSDKYFACKLCAIRFQNSDLMEQHFQMKHENVKSSKNCRNPAVISAIVGKRTKQSAMLDCNLPVYMAADRSDRRSVVQQPNSPTISSSSTSTMLSSLTSLSSTSSTTLVTTNAKSTVVGSGKTMAAAGTASFHQTSCPSTSTFQEDDDLESTPKKTRRQLKQALLMQNKSSLITRSCQSLLRNDETMLSRLGVAQNRLPRGRKGVRNRRLGNIDLCKLEINTNFIKTRSKVGRVLTSNITDIMEPPPPVVRPNINNRVESLSSTTFDDDFYETVSANVRLNLSCHLDGKLESGPMSPSPLITALPVPTIRSTVVRSPLITDSEIHEATTLAATTAFPTLLTAEQYGCDLAVATKIKKPITKNSWKWKWDCVKKYKYVNEGGKIVKKVKQPMAGLRDLSKLDMWTQLTMRTKHEFVTKKANILSGMNEVLPLREVEREEKRKQIAQLDTILDTRRLPQIVLEQSEQTIIKSEIIDPDDEDAAINSSGIDMTIVTTTTASTIESESITSTVTSVVNFAVTSRENPEQQRDKEYLFNMLNLYRRDPDAHKNQEEVILSGEWARPRCYICYGCGAKFDKLKTIEEHKMFRHPHVYSTHYEIVGRELIEGDLYKHFFIPTKALHRHKLYRQMLERQQHMLIHPKTEDCNTNESSNTAVTGSEESMDSVTSISASTITGTSKSECESEFKNGITTRTSSSISTTLEMDDELTTTTTTTTTTTATTMSGIDSLEMQSSIPKTCTKCNRECSGILDLYRHILDCSGDYAWILAKKRKYRYYAGSRRRRSGRQNVAFQHRKSLKCLPSSPNIKLEDKIPNDNSSINEITASPASSSSSMSSSSSTSSASSSSSVSIKSKDTLPATPRPSKASDAESIRRMLENLPAKRACRQIIPNITKPRVRKFKTPSGIGVKKKTILVNKGCGKKAKASVVNVASTTVTAITKSIGRKHKRIFTRQLKKKSHVVRCISKTQVINKNKKIKNINIAKRNRNSTATENTESAKKESEAEEDDEVEDEEEEDETLAVEVAVAEQAATTTTTTTTEIITTTTTTTTTEITETTTGLSSPLSSASSTVSLSPPPSPSPISEVTILQKNLKKSRKANVVQKIKKNTNNIVRRVTRDFRQRGGKHEATSPSKEVERVEKTSENAHAIEKDSERNIKNSTSANVQHNDNVGEEHNLDSSEEDKNKQKSSDKENSHKNSSKSTTNEKSEPSTKPVTADPVTPATDKKKRGRKPKGSPNNQSARARKFAYNERGVKSLPNKTSEFEDSPSVEKEMPRPLSPKNSAEPATNEAIVLPEVAIQDTSAVPVTAIETVGNAEKPQTLIPTMTRASKRKSVRRIIPLTDSNVGVKNSLKDDESDSNNEWKTINDPVPNASAQVADVTKADDNSISFHNNPAVDDTNKTDTVTDNSNSVLKSHLVPDCSIGATNPNLSANCKKRGKKLNDCIAMLTGKLQEKLAGSTIAVDSAPKGRKDLRKPTSSTNEDPSKKSGTSCENLAPLCLADREIAAQNFNMNLEKQNIVKDQPPNEKTPKRKTVTRKLITKDSAAIPAILNEPVVNLNEPESQKLDPHPLNQSLQNLTYPTQPRGPITYQTISPQNIDPEPINEVAIHDKMKVSNLVSTDNKPYTFNVTSSLNTEPATASVIHSSPTKTINTAEKPKKRRKAIAKNFQEAAIQTSPTDLRMEASTTPTSAAKCISMIPTMPPQQQMSLLSFPCPPVTSLLAPAVPFEAQQSFDSQNCREMLLPTDPYGRQQQQQHQLLQQQHILQQQQQVTPLALTLPLPSLAPPLSLPKDLNLIPNSVGSNGVQTSIGTNKEPEWKSHLQHADAVGNLCYPPPPPPVAADSQSKYPNPTVTITPTSIASASEMAMSLESKFSNREALEFYRSAVNHQNYIESAERRAEISRGSNNGGTSITSSKTDPKNYSIYDSMMKNPNQSLSQNLSQSNQNSKRKVGRRKNPTNTSPGCSSNVNSSNPPPPANSTYDMVATCDLYNNNPLPTTLLRSSEYHSNDSSKLPYLSSLDDKVNSRIRESAQSKTHSIHHGEVSSNVTNNTDKFPEYQPQKSSQHIQQRYMLPPPLFSESQSLAQSHLSQLMPAPGTSAVSEVDTSLPLNLKVVKKGPETSLDSSKHLSNIHRDLIERNNQMIASYINSANSLMMTKSMEPFELVRGGATITASRESVEHTHNAAQQNVIMPDRSYLKNDVQTFLPVPAVQNGLSDSRRGRHRIEEFTKLQHTGGLDITGHIPSQIELQRYKEPLNMTNIQVATAMCGYETNPYESGLPSYEGVTCDTRVPQRNEGGNNANIPLLSSSSTSSSMSTASSSSSTSNHQMMAVESHSMRRDDDVSRTRIYRGRNKKEEAFPTVDSNYLTVPTMSKNVCAYSIDKILRKDAQPAPANISASLSPISSTSSGYKVLPQQISPDVRSITSSSYPITPIELDAPIDLSEASQRRRQESLCKENYKDLSYIGDEIVWKKKRAPSIYRKDYNVITQSNQESSCGPNIPESTDNIIYNLPDSNQAVMSEIIPDNVPLDLHVAPKKKAPAQTKAERKIVQEATSTVTIPKVVKPVEAEGDKQENLPTKSISSCNLVSSVSTLETFDPTSEKPPMAAPRRYQRSKSQPPKTEKVSAVSYKTKSVRAEKTKANRRNARATRSPGSPCNTQERVESLSDDESVKSGKRKDIPEPKKLAEIEDIVASFCEDSCDNKGQLTSPKPTPAPVEKAAPVVPKDLPKLLVGPTRLADEIKQLGSGDELDGGRSTEKPEESQEKTETKIVSEPKLPVSRKGRKSVPKITPKKQDEAMEENIVPDTVLNATTKKTRRRNPAKNKKGEAIELEPSNAVDSGKKFEKDQMENEKAPTDEDDEPESSTKVSKKGAKRIPKRKASVKSESTPVTKRDNKDTKNYQDQLRSDDDSDDDEDKRKPDAGGCRIAIPIHAESPPQAEPAPKLAEIERETLPESASEVIKDPTIDKENVKPERKLDANTADPDSQIKEKDLIRLNTSQIDDSATILYDEPVPGPSGINNSNPYDDPVPGPSGLNSSNPYEDPIPGPSGLNTGAKKPRRRRKNELASIIADQLMESFKEVDQARIDDLKRLENLAYEKSEELLLTGMRLAPTTKRKAYEAKENPDNPDKNKPKPKPKRRSKSQPNIRTVAKSSRIGGSDDPKNKDGPSDPDKKPKKPIDRGFQSHESILSAMSREDGGDYDSDDDDDDDDNLPKKKRNIPGKGRGGNKKGEERDPKDLRDRLPDPREPKIPKDKNDENVPPNREDNSEPDEPLSKLTNSKPSGSSNNENETFGSTAIRNNSFETFQSLNRNEAAFVGQTRKMEPKAGNFVPGSAETSNSIDSQPQEELTQPNDSYDKMKLMSGHSRKAKKRTSRKKERKTSENDHISELRTGLESFSLAKEKNESGDEAKAKSQKIIQPTANVSETAPKITNFREAFERNNEAEASKKPLIRPSILSILNSEQTAAPNSSAANIPIKPLSSRDPRLNKKKHDPTTSEEANNRPQPTNAQAQPASAGNNPLLDDRQHDSEYEDTCLAQLARSVNDRIMSNDDDEEFNRESDGFNVPPPERTRSPIYNEASMMSTSRGPESYSIMMAGRCSPSGDNDPIGRIPAPPHDEHSNGTFLQDDDNTNTELIDMDLEDDISVYTSFSQDVMSLSGKPRRRRRRKSLLLTSRKSRKHPEDPSAPIETFNCDICNKSFRKSVALSKHQMTLTHIAKLSEREYLSASRENIEKQRNEEEAEGQGGKEQEKQENAESDWCRNADVNATPVSIQNEKADPNVDIPKENSADVPKLISDDQQLPPASAKSDTMQDKSPVHEQIEPVEVAPAQPSGIEPISSPEQLENNYDSRYHNSSRIALSQEERLFYECCNMLKGSETPMMDRNYPATAPTAYNNVTSSPFDVPNKPVTPRSGERFSYLGSDVTVNFQHNTGYSVKSPMSQTRTSPRPAYPKIDVNQFSDISSDSNPGFPRMSSHQHAAFQSNMIGSGPGSAADDKTISYNRTVQPIATIPHGIQNNHPNSSQLRSQYASNHSGHLGATQLPLLGTESDAGSLTARTYIDEDRTKDVQPTKDTNSERNQAFTSPIHSTSSQGSTTYRMRTKAAMKGYDNFKVSICTAGLDMQQALERSPHGGCKLTALAEIALGNEAPLGTTQYPIYQLKEDIGPSITVDKLKAKIVDLEPIVKLPRSYPSLVTESNEFKLRRRRDNDIRKEDLSTVGFRLRTRGKAAEVESDSQSPKIVSSEDDDEEEEQIVVNNKTSSGQRTEPPKDVYDFEDSQEVQKEERTLGKLRSSKNTADEIVIPDRPFKGIGMEQQNTIKFHKPIADPPAVQNEESCLSSTSYSDRDDFNFGSMSENDDANNENENGDENDDERGKENDDDDDGQSDTDSNSTAKTLENKCRIMGRIFKNATKNRTDESKFEKAASQPANEQKKKLPTQELDKLFDSLRKEKQEEKTKMEEEPQITVNVSHPVRHERSCRSNINGLKLSNQSTVTSKTPSNSVQLKPQSVPPVLAVAKPLTNSTALCKVPIRPVQVESVPIVTQPKPDPGPSKVSQNNQQKDIKKKTNEQVEIIEENEDESSEDDAKSQAPAKASRRKPPLGVSREIYKLQAELGMSAEDVAELINEGTRKSQRRCAANTQRKLIETWSSDEYEDFLTTNDIMALIEEKEKRSRKRKPTTGRNNEPLNMNSEQTQGVTQGVPNSDTAKINGLVEKESVEKKASVSKKVPSKKVNKKPVTRKAVAENPIVAPEVQDLDEATSETAKTVTPKCKKPTAVKKSKNSGVPCENTPSNPLPSTSGTQRRTVQNRRSIDTIGSSSTNTSTASTKKPTLSVKPRYKTNLEESESDFEDEWRRRSGTSKRAKSKKRRKPNIFKEDSRRALNMSHDSSDVRQPQSEKDNSENVSPDQPTLSAKLIKSVSSDTSNCSQLKSQEKNTIIFTSSTTQPLPDTEDAKNKEVASQVRPLGRRKRIASEMLYYWSSSSDEEFGRIETRDDDDVSQDGEHYQQHGWIVGDSHKKLVTLLAIAKGKKADDCGVKETNPKKKS